jgi:hypothetical protein
MDMTEDNDLLLRQFFSEAAQQKIEDNGFTERVMQRLEANQQAQSSLFESEQSSSAKVKVQIFTRLWTAFCILVAFLLFSALHGWELLIVQLEVLLRTLPTEPFSGRLFMLVTIFVGLLIAGASEVISSSETVRK